MAVPGTEPRPSTPDAPSAADQGAAAPPPYRRLYRSPSRRVLGGVAYGLSVHLGLPATWVRIAFILLFFAHGVGGLLYAAFWVVVPIGLGEPPPGSRPPYGPYAAPPPFTPPEGRGGRLREPVQRPFHGEPSPGAGVAEHGGFGRPAALLALVIGIMALLNALHIETAQPYVWPLLTIGVGVALVWRQADDSRWQRWLELEAGSHRGIAWARASTGVLLVLGGIVGFFILRGVASPVVLVIQSTLAVLAGCLVLVGPYALRLWQDLAAERTARIRAQERAEIAAHVHDSVLHTLALIQRQADDPKEVLRLARAQERELRLWLYRPEAAEEAAPDTMAERIRGVVAEVEDRHGVPVELVVVGDCPMDERIAAQLQAAREAMVNAAKYGGGAPVRVYAEVEGRTVSVFVRDHGPGFDPDGVPEDRMGVRESIVGRMRRNGGTARVRPAPDGGTEVELEMERAADD